MKTITLTMLQAVRLALMLDGAQGQRKDLGILQDIRRRLNLPEETLTKYVRPIPGGLAIAEEVTLLPSFEMQIAPAEIRRLVEVIDAQTFIVRDLTWLDPLVEQLLSPA
jgi:hypothetical protein